MYEDIDEYFNPPINIPIDKNILVPLELCEYLWYDNEDDIIDIYNWKKYKYIDFDIFIWNLDFNNNDYE
jgi:hypothetical protein